MPHSPAARALFRRCLRAAARWDGLKARGPGTDPLTPDALAAEAAFIRDEARALFRQHRAAGPAEGERLLKEGARRVEIALHYGIAYERPTNFALGPAKPPTAMAPPSTLDEDERLEADMDLPQLEDNPALAAAMARRRDRRQQAGG